MEEFLDAPICATCGVQYPPSGSKPPLSCFICSDDRQYVPKGGQVWTNFEKLKLQYKNAYQKSEPGVYEIITVPKLGIGQRAFIIQTAGGNILWDCITFLDEATIDIVNALGGLKAIAISHPHYYSSNKQWSAAFGGVPVYIHERDKNWVAWLHKEVHFWSGEILQLWAGVTLLHLGGHFAGAQVLHWKDAANGKGALFTGDILQIGMDNSTVSIMRSYPNYIPLSRSHVDRIVTRLLPWEFDRAYGAFMGQIESNAKSRVEFSLKRYVEWLHSDDPDA